MTTPSNASQSASCILLFLLSLCLASASVAGAMPQADLSLVFTTDRAYAIAGEPLIYELTVSNAGPDNAPSTDVTVTLPADVALVATAGCVGDPTGLPICKLQTVNAGASKQATITVLVADGASGELVLEASVKSSREDPNPADNMVTVVTPLAVEDVIAEGSSPAIAADPTSTQNFVIAWEAPGSAAFDHGFDKLAGGSNGIAAQLFDNTGMPVGIELRLDQSGSSHTRPDVARRTNGQFVAAWQSEDADDFGVFGRLFDATGMPVGIELRFNSLEGGTQSRPAVAGLGDGRFVATWSDEESLGSFVRALRLFSPTGMPVGIELRFGSSDIAAKPPAAAVSDSRILVTWEDAADRIAAQLFDLSGMPVGIELQLASVGVNAEPKAAPHPDGGFVVVWQNDDAADLDGSGVFGRRIAFDGMPVGIEFRVNQVTAGNQQRPAIAASPDGTFAVTWQSPDDDGTGIFARLLDNTGMPVGIELLMSLSGTGEQTSAEPAFIDEDGTYYVAWQSDEDTSEIVIAPPSSLFTDGFESGDLSAWGEQSP